ncbi:MAG TPA: hypothetical protein DCQ06_12025 [Myxococcales bacterium]|nr:hypothetical protein [Myxococcales bacterium]
MWMMPMQNAWSQDFLHERLLTPTPAQCHCSHQRFRQASIRRQMPTESKDRGAKGSMSPLRRLVPIVGTIGLLGYLASSTDLQAVADAVRHASVSGVITVLVIATIATWVGDSACLAWLISRNLAGRGNPQGTSMRQLLAIKAGSYVLNIINYNAATLGMAYLVAKRRKVSFIEATAALSVLSYIDLLALALLVTTGLQVAPEVLGVLPGLVDRLIGLVTIVFTLGVGILLVIQSPLKWGPLDRLRAWSLIRPLAAMNPLDMGVGVAMRASFVMLYVAANYAMMLCFGMTPALGPMLVIVPVLTVVGVVPLSISGIGTTQLLMRTLYAPFVSDGRDPTPVIDAWSTVLIFGFILVRLVVAIPYLRTLMSELNQRESPHQQDPQSQK